MENTHRIQIIVWKVPIKHKNTVCVCVCVYVAWLSSPVHFFLCLVGANSWQWILAPTGCTAVYLNSERDAVKETVKLNNSFKSCGCTSCFFIMPLSEIFESWHWAVRYFWLMTAKMYCCPCSTTLYCFYHSAVSLFTRIINWRRYQKLEHLVVSL